MNILITGAFGFVGTNLSQALNTTNKQYLIAVDLKENPKHFYDEFFTWKNMDSINWNKIDVIIHLAGKAHDSKSTTNDKSYFDINVGLTQQIFGYFARSGASKFIFLSSVKAIADCVLGKKLKETDIPHPETPYGKSKLEAEIFLLSQILPENKKLYILRSCMIHGPGNKGNLNLLYKAVKKGIPCPLGLFNNKRSFTSIGNLIFVINQILQKDIKQGVYQISDDEVVSTNRLIQLIAESMKKKPRIWNINKNILLKVAQLGDILRLPINRERLKKLSETYIVSNKKLKKALGSKKMPICAEEGFRRTLETF